MAATVAVALAVTVAPMGRLTGIANADGSVVLGGGAGIIVNGTYCTLGTVGHDGSGELVGFTSSHCGGPGSQVAAEDSGVTVGSVVATSGDPKYAVIKFDRAKVTPTANFAGFAINGIGSDPVLGQGVCAHGGATEDRAADQGDDGHTDCDESTPTCPAPDTKDQTVSWDKIRPDPREQGDVVRQPVGDRATFTH